MTIDPRIGMWISIVAAALAFIGASTAELTTLFDATTAQKIVAACAFIGGGINAINAVLHMIPSQNTSQASQQFLLGPKS